MQEKTKSYLTMIAGIVGVVWLVYYLGARVIDYMVKLHGG